MYKKRVICNKVMHMILMNAYKLRVLSVHVDVPPAC